ncbi:MAG: START domain-containing protein [Polyangia bacterium]
MIWFSWLLLPVLASVAGFLFWRHGRRRTPAARFLLRDLDPAAIVDAVDSQLDGAHWKLAIGKDGVAVYTSTALPCPFTGFKTVTEHSASLDDLTAFLGDGILGAFSQMNRRYVFGEDIPAPGSSKLRVVRTGFSMPAGMSSREFLHLLHVALRGPERRFVVYHSVDDPELPARRPGFVRCPVYPSGQRLTRLASGRIRVEHLMVYDLAGSVSPWVQNTLLRRGHAATYHAEWLSLVELFEKATT